MIYEKRIFGVSDLHLDDGTGPFTENKNHDKFMRFTQTVGDDMLVLTGDILDLWRWSADSIIHGPNADIVKYLTAKENDYVIVGNHDLDIKLMKKIFQKNVYLSLIINDWLMFHGHVVDARLDTPQEREIVKQISLIIQKVNIGILNKFRDWAANGPRDNSAYRTQFTGTNLAMGHTHQAEIKVNYVNPGVWVGDKCHYWLLEKGVMSLHDIF